MKRLETPPGPVSRPILGFIPEMKKDPLGFLVELASQYPRLTHFNLGSQPVYFTNDANVARHILLENAKIYHKLWGYDKFYPIFGKGLLTSNGDFWKKQRKLAQPAFHRQRLQNFAQAMVHRTEAMLHQWENYADQGKSFELGEETRKITMDIVTQTMFGIHDSKSTAMVGRAINIILAETYNRVFTVTGGLLERIPTFRNIEFKKACQQMDKLVYSIIEDRQKSGEDKGDLLSMYMQTVDDETGERMNPKQLKDEVMTIFFAGHETSAHAVAWTCYLLSKHPEVARKLDVELREVLHGKNPSFEDLSKLVYLKMVIEESMRLFPPSWIMTRSAVEDDVIEGYRIPKGSVIIISEFAMHRNPEYWPNPEGFDPERFRPENMENQPKFSYLAFGQGPRYCVGAGFAIMEIQIILSMILQKFRVDLVPGHPIEPEPVMTLRPKFGVMVTAVRK